MILDTAVMNMIYVTENKIIILILLEICEQNLDMIFHLSWGEDFHE